jgi:hypothetical protein
MQIMAVLAILGATLGQPGDPPGQDMPAEQQDEQQADTESPPADEQPAEQQQPEADSSTADEQPAEQQQPEADSSTADEQPGETGGDDASAGLDEASGAAHWPEVANRLVERYTSEDGRTVGPYHIVDVQRRQPALVLDVDIRSQFWPTEVEEDVIRWMCDRQLQMFTAYAGGILIVNLHDPAGQHQTVTITRCLHVPRGAG